MAGAIVIHDRYGVLVDAAGTPLIPHHYRRHRVSTCSAGRDPGPTYQAEAVMRCHQHCWDVSEHMTLDKPIQKHCCWRGRKENHYRRHSSRGITFYMFIGPPEGQDTVSAPRDHIIPPGAYSFIRFSKL